MRFGLSLFVGLACTPHKQFDQPVIVQIFAMAVLPCGCRVLGLFW